MFINKIYKAKKKKKCNKCRVDNRRFLHKNNSLLILMRKAEKCQNNFFVDWAD